jgi:hypothetical protein
MAQTKFKQACKFALLRHAPASVKRMVFILYVSFHVYDTQLVSLHGSFSKTGIWTKYHINSSKRFTASA